VGLDKNLQLISELTIDRGTESISIGFNIGIEIAGYVKTFTFRKVNM
jgi:Na+/serine symporter